MKAGDRFGRLVLIDSFKNKGRTFWNVLCDCGVKKSTRHDGIKDGKTLSCGCLSAENSSKRNTKHGKSQEPFYASWNAMMNRCYNNSHDSFFYYGHRGIKVSEKWHDPDEFFKDMGNPKPGQQLDRINSDGNYEPGNCRWTTCKENLNNRRNTRFITANGQTLPASKWSEITGIPLKTIHTRLHRGWSDEQTIQKVKE